MQALAAHGRRPRKRRRPLLVLAVVAVVLAAGAGVYLAIRPSSSASSSAGSAAYPGTRHGSGGNGSAASTPARPLTVVSSDPAPGATDVAPDATLTVRLSDPLAADSPLPSLAPPVAGAWTRSGATATFTPAGPFVPGTTETITVPGGALGARSSAGSLLAAPYTATFGIARGSTLRLQQLLAELGYLPVDFTQSGPEPAAASLADVQPGTFAWRWPSFPSDLTALWTQGLPNVITQGAVMTFQNQHGLKVDGIAGPQVWGALLKDAAAGTMDAAPYTYAYVNKNLPETLTVYVNGNPQYANIPVNTGVPGADTADGTYPVFEHVQSSEMKGTNPDGSTYDDPNVPWASYFNGGDALHGFVRPSYGSPQSNGCVEMPIATAAVLWPLTPVGTLVTVVGPPPS